jgi:hypothetical protein
MALHEDYVPNYATTVGSGVFERNCLTFLAYSVGVMALDRSLWDMCSP